MSCCQTDKKACCASSEIKLGLEAPGRPLEVEFLYLDRTVCTRCKGTEEALRDAVEEARRILGPVGIDVTLKMTHVRSEDEARLLGFISSPTVRLMGRDAAVAVRENPCSGCGELGGCEITCRVWTWRGQEYSVPPREMFLDAILRDAYLYPAGERILPAPLQELPANLRKFFRAQQP